MEEEMAIKISENLRQRFQTDVHWKTIKECAELELLRIDEPDYPL